MYIPQKNIEDFSLDLVEKCQTSRETRMQAGSLWKQYYFNGTNQPAQVPYNLCYPHIDSLSSYLFSPGEANFRLYSSIGDSENNVPKDWQETWMEKLKLAKKKPEPLKWPNWQEMRHLAAHFLNSEFSRTGVNATFASGVDGALMKGSSFVKILWGHDGFEPYVVQPEMMGVLREDVNGLHRQEAFTHTSFITFTQFLQKIKGHPQEEKMIQAVKKRARKSKAGEKYENEFLHQIVIGGIATASNPAGNIKASTNIFGTPYPRISPKVQENLLVCHEIWIQDDDTEDYTTIQIIEPDIVIEGKLRRRNLSGIKGETPFIHICANHVDGYFWGMSELMPLRPLQDMANVRVSQINRILRRRARPAKALSGFSGDQDQARKQIDAPDGLLVEGPGQGMKIENLAPDSPKDAYESLKETVEMFYTVAGFNPIMRGQGESGVRSGVHADTLVRNSSPRMRDRAILLEQQYADAGNLCFRMLQAKNAMNFVTHDGEEFLLSQLPDDTKAVVDSHSSSPAFSEDNRQLALQLAKIGAIDAGSLLEMVNPPNEQELVAKFRKKQEQEAALIAQHPELLDKKKGKK